uniref:Secreted protein n=1 Tax=Anopheles farauti TaxID=69004 RepID=A0A182QR50_9DIPT
MAKIRTLCAVVLGVLALFVAANASPVPGTSVGTSVSSEENSAEIEGMLKEVEEMCRNNSGSDAAYVKVLGTFEQTMTCAVSSIDFDRLIVDADALNNETRKTFFPRYCPQLRTAYSCFDKLVNDFRPCLEEDDFTIVRALVGILPDALELLCKNDGELLFKFDEPKYAECFEKLGDNFDQCTQAFLNGTDDWDISHMTEGQCNTMTGFRQCVQNQMSICKAPDLISVYDLFHNALFRMTPCRNYVTLQKVEIMDNNAIDEN